MLRRKEDFTFTVYKIFTYKEHDTEKTFVKMVRFETGHKIHATADIDNTGNFEFPLQKAFYLAKVKHKCRS